MVQKALRKGGKVLGGVAAVAAVVGGLVLAAAFRGAVAKIPLPIDHDPTGYLQFAVLFLALVVIGTAVALPIWGLLCVARKAGWVTTEVAEETSDMDKSIRSQSFRVLDTETTGLDPRTDAVVELAWAIMQGDGTVLSSDSTLINPGRRIPADATRLHGISDRDVAQAPTLEQAVEAHSQLYSPVLPAVCHNASFDSVLLRRSRSLAKGNPRYLCTLRLAENLLPGRKSYTLDSLRSGLRLGARRKRMPAHRAAADVATTCSLLKHLIDKYLAAGHPDNIEKLFEVASIQRMPFGKHEGQLLSQMPADYIDWLLGRDIDDELRAALRNARKGRRSWWPS